MERASRVNSPAHLEASSAPLGPDTIGGLSFDNVNHLVTTNIAGAAIPEPSTALLLGIGMALLSSRVRRSAPSQHTQREHSGTKGISFDGRKVSAHAEGRLQPGDRWIEPDE